MAGHNECMNKYCLKFHKENEFLFKSVIATLLNRSVRFTAEYDGNMCLSIQFESDDEFFAKMKNAMDQALKGEDNHG